MSHFKKKKVESESYFVSKILLPNRSQFPILSPCHPKILEVYKYSVSIW
jgi:hypothetical protein